MHRWLASRLQALHSPRGPVLSSVISWSCRQNCRPSLPRCGWSGSMPASIIRCRLAALTVSWRVGTGCTWHRQSHRSTGLPARSYDAPGLRYLRKVGQELYLPDRLQWEDYGTP